MAKRGPKPKFRPIPPKSAGGSYTIYLPGTGIISLETSDEKEAWTKAHGYAQNYAAGGMNSPSSVRPDIPSVTENAAPIPQPPASEMLDKWSNSQTSSEPPSQQSFPFPSQSQSAPESPPITGSNQSPSVSDKVNAVMPPEKRAKIAGMLAKGITLMNVAGAAWCVRLLGTIPKIEDEEEATDVLKIGWELQLEELFVNHPPQPWMVIAGGTAALMTGMLLNGERIPKKDKRRATPPESPASKLEFGDDNQPS